MDALWMCLFWRFLGASKKEFMDKVKDLKDDSKIEAWARNLLKNKSKKEIEDFNNNMRHSKPKDKSGMEWLESEKKKLGRKDYFSYFDNLDADEKRF